MTGSHANPALEGPVVATFFRYLIPSMVGLISMTSASIVDGIFIGNYVGVTALAAVNLIIPIISLLYGVVLMLSIGGAVRAGRYLGEGNIPAASSIFSKTLLFVLGMSLLVILAGFAFESSLFAAVGATEELFPVMSEYYRLLLPFMPTMLVVLVLYFFIRVDNFPNLAAAALAAGALTNVMLDYLLIAVLGWGLTGAALATGLAQSIPILVMLAYFYFPKRKLRFRCVQRNWKEVLQAAYNGISEFINEVSGAIIAFILNWMLIVRAGVDGVAAITVIFYLIFLGYMVFYAISDSIQVLVSQNFGSRDTARVRKFLRTATVTIMFCSLAFVVLLTSSNETLFRAFVNDTGSDKAIRLAVEFVYYLWPLFLFAGFNMLVSGYLTAAHLPFQSGTIAVCRSLIFPGLLLLLFQHLFSDYRFLIGLPLAEAIAFMLAVVMYRAHVPVKAIVAPETTAADEIAL